MAISLEQLSIEDKARKIVKGISKLLKADIREDIETVIRGKVNCGSCGERIKKDNNGEEIFYSPSTGKFYLERVCLNRGIADYKKRVKNYHLSEEEMRKEAEKISYEEALEIANSPFRKRSI